jgi:hypothetical protein
MKQRKIVLALLACLSLVITACHKDYDPVSIPQRNIFPMIVGRERIYQAVDTNYESSVAGGKEGREFFRKEYYAGEETDLLGRIVKRVEIQESPYVLDSAGNPVYDFTPTEIWTQYADSFSVECTEGTTRLYYLKMPPYPTSTWNGNLYNAEQPQTYYYANLDTTVVANGVTWDHCVFVMEAPYSNINSPSYRRQEYAYQVYAPYVGKIIRHRQRVIYQGADLQGAESFYIHEELIRHNF